jgi:phospholipid N-methyltransferase
MTARATASFFREFLDHPHQVGAIIPSSDRLSERIVQAVDWSTVQNVIEVGPGTGVATRMIFEYKPPQAKFLAIERSPRFVTHLQQRFPELTVVNDCVSNVEQICRAHDIAGVDAVVSGLPWTLFSEQDQTRYLEALMTVMRPGGQFTTFAYLTAMVLPSAQRFRDKLSRYFSVIQRSRVVWRNLPPAFVYRACR